MFTKKSLKKSPSTKFKITHLIWPILFLVLTIRYFATKPNYHEGDYLKLSGKIMSEPRYTHSSQTFFLLSLKVILPRLPQLNYGDYVVVEGIYKDNGLINSRLVIHKKTNLFSLRKKILDFYQKNLPPNHSALVSGIVLGSKQTITPSFYQSLKRSGTIHVVVASGMNVTLVAGFLVSALITVLPRKRAVIISIIGIWIYVLLAGLEPPLIRAGIMGTIAFSAQALGRVYSAVRGLLISGIIMLIISPAWLTDLGFILSFVATLSLMLFESKISRLIRFTPEILRQGLSTSLAAQIGVAPIIYLSFGQFNPLSPITNALILWTVPHITIIGSLAGVVGLIFPALGKLILLLIYPLTWWFIVLVS